MGACRSTDSAPCSGRRLPHVARTREQVWNRCFTLHDLRLLQIRVLSIDVNANFTKGKQNCWIYGCDTDGNDNKQSIRNTGSENFHMNMIDGIHREFFNYFSHIVFTRMYCRWSRYLPFISHANIHDVHQLQVYMFDYTNLWQHYMW